MGNATGLYTLVRQLGGSLGIALLELLQTRREDLAQSVYASSITLGSGPVAMMLHGTHDRTAAMAQVAGMVDQNATVVSYDYIFQFCAVVFVLSIPTVLLLAKPKKAPPGEAAVVIE
jgi:DHA2 family multidrug resistance protein